MGRRCVTSWGSDLVLRRRLSEQFIPVIEMGKYRLSWEQEVKNVLVGVWFGQLGR